MAKKIVILNGSPRKSGNTSALVKKFTEGAESVGNTVTEFFLDRMDIHGCKGVVSEDTAAKNVPVFKRTICQRFTLPSERAM